jgi:hypothetical protein
MHLRILPSHLQISDWLRRVCLLNPLNEVFSGIFSMSYQVLHCNLMKSFGRVTPAKFVKSVAQIVGLFIEHQDFVQASSFNVEDLRRRLEALDEEAVGLKEVLLVRDQHLLVLETKNSVLENCVALADSFLGH